MKYLLDTCVISELESPGPTRALSPGSATAIEEQMAISVASIAGIQSGIARVSESERRPSLEVWLTKDLIPQFELRILALDLQANLAWGAAMGRA